VPGASCIRTFYEGVGFTNIARETLSNSGKGNCTAQTSSFAWDRKWERFTHSANTFAEYENVWGTFGLPGPRAHSFLFS